MFPTRLAQCIDGSTTRLYESLATATNVFSITLSVSDFSYGVSMSSFGEGTFANAGWFGAALKSLKSYVTEPSDQRSLFL